MLNVKEIGVGVPQLRGRGAVCPQVSNQSIAVARKRSRFQSVRQSCPGMDERVECGCISLSTPTLHVTQDVPQEPLAMAVSSYVSA